MIENMLAFSDTAVGYNHIKEDKVCEDASDYYSDEKMKICLVADGHGSDNYPRTDRGAKFAVEAAKNCIIQFVELAESNDVLNDERNDYRSMLQLTTSILKDWYQAIENDYNNNPFTEVELEKVSDKYKRRFLSTDITERRVEKAYGCTLIAYVVTDDYSFGLQIGDGKCVCVDKKGDFSEPIPWDDECQMNVTTSICDENAIEEFRFTISNQMPLAVFCGTDGIDDSYVLSEDLYALYRSIIKIFIEHGNEVGIKEIEAYLPNLTKRGSGDDVSIGLIYDSDSAKRVKNVFMRQDEIYKLTSRLKEQKHQMNIFKVNGLKEDKERLALDIVESEKKIRRIKEEISSFQLDMEDSSYDEVISSIEPENEDSLFAVETHVADVLQEMEDTVAEEIISESGAISCEDSLTFT